MVLCYDSPRKLAHLGWNLSFLILEIRSPLPQNVKAAWSVVSDITGPHSYLHQIACSGGKPVRGIRQEKDTTYQSFQNMALGKGSWSGARTDGEETVQKGCYCPKRNVDGLAVGMRRDWWLWEVLGGQACGSANMLDLGPVWESVSWEAQVFGMSNWVAGGSIETRREQFTVSDLTWPMQIEMDWL